MTSPRARTAQRDRHPETGVDPARPGWRWWGAAILAVLASLATWTYFALDLRAVENPRITSELTMGQTARQGPSTFRLDGFDDADSLPGDEGKAVRAPEGTRFVVVHATQTLVAPVDLESYYCSFDILGEDGRHWDNRADEVALVTPDTETYASLCQNVDGDHPLVRGQPRALTFRFVVPDSVTIKGMRLWEAGSGGAVLFRPPSAG